MIRYPGGWRMFLFDVALIVYIVYGVRVYLTRHP
jgi:hypothetical protein